MEARTVAILPTVIVALMIGASFYAIAVLPPDALVPTHFNLSGKPDAFAHPLIAFSILPAVAFIGVVILFVVARQAGSSFPRSEAAIRVMIVGPFAILAITLWLQIAYALGSNVNVTRVLVMVAGVVFVVTGNVLGKIRRNRWVGVRTPWTLRDEQVWDRTHRFSGWVFVGAGAALALAAIAIPAGPVLGAVLFSTIAFIVIVPTVKSYLLWRERRNV